jgi:hypothetical protein
MKNKFIGPYLSSAFRGGVKKVNCPPYNIFSALFGLCGRYFGKLATLRGHVRSEAGPGRPASAA